MPATILLGECSEGEEETEVQRIREARRKDEFAALRQGLLQVGDSWSSANGVDPPIVLDEDAI